MWMFMNNPPQAPHGYFPCTAEEAAAELVSEEQPAAEDEQVENAPTQRGGSPPCEEEEVQAFPHAMIVFFVAICHLPA